METYVITISRQVGSGAAYVGHRLAARLRIAYIDREIVQETARRLSISEQAVCTRDERVTPLWRSMLESSIYVSPQGYIPPKIGIPSDIELISAVQAHSPVLKEPRQHPVNDSGSDLALNVITDNRDVSLFKTPRPLHIGRNKYGNTVDKSDTGP